MKFSWVPLPQPRTLFLALGSLGIIGGVILICQLCGIMLCPLRRYTGIPCFTCGSTRAVLALVSGDIKTAFLTQPLIILLVCCMAPLALFILCTALLKKRLVMVSFSRPEKMILLLFFAIATLVNWLYLLYMNPAS